MQSKNMNHFRSTSHINIPAQTNNFEISRKKRSSFYGIKLMSPQQSTSNKPTPTKEVKQFVEIDRKSLLDLFSDDNTVKSINSNNTKMNNYGGGG